MRNIITISILFYLISFVFNVKAQFDIKAKTAILQDYLSGEILYEKEPDDNSQTLFACGGAFMVDSKRYLELGGFDNLYHPLYYEEIDLSYR